MGAKHCWFACRRHSQSRRHLIPAPGQGPVSAGLWPGIGLADTETKGQNDMETKTAKHTRLEWKARRINEANARGPKGHHEIAQGGGCVVQCVYSEARAQEIVLAVNCHDDMLDMLKAVEARISIEQQEHMDDPAPATYCCGAIHIEMLALIAKAEGRPTC